MIYTVVDIETTGGSHGNRITEIAAVKTDGKQVLGSYETLINPEVFIPKSITLLTGITNTMVEDAPRFEDIADDTAIGRLTQTLVQVGVPGGVGFKLASAAVKAKKAGNYMNINGII